MDEELIQQIVENVDIVETIQKYIELKPKRDEFFACCPFHDEDTPSFSVTPSKHTYYCFGCHAGGTVINFIQHIENVSYFEALKMLSDEFGIKPFNKKKSKTYEILKKANRSSKLLDIKHPILNEDILNKYSKEPIKEWISEGISQKIMNRYQVMYDKSGDRIVYPVYDINGDLINIKGRTLCDDHKILGIPKYMNYYKIGDMDYFQGLNLKKKLIQESGEMIIFEGLKSCMKADGYQYYNSVSSETSVLNSYQIRLILKMKCNVVVAYDNDVDYTIPKIKKSLDILAQYTNVFVIQDVDHILGDAKDKLSPVDKGKEVWEELYKNKRRWNGVGICQSMNLY